MDPSLTVPDPGTRLRRMKTLASTIQEACTLSGESRERLMSLAYRESWCGFAPGYSPMGNPIGWGDKDYAFGFFQIDKRYHRDFIISELGRYMWSLKHKLPYSSIQQALYTCRLLRDGREWFRRNSGVSGTVLERAVFAAYNAGPVRVRDAILAGKDVDSPTTGKDYSKYIFTLSDALQRPQNQWIWS